MPCFVRSLQQRILEGVVVSPSRHVRLCGQSNGQGLPVDEVDMTNAEAFMIQDGSYIDASRDEVIAQFGSFDRFAGEMLGLDPSVISELRNTPLE